MTITEKFGEEKIARVIEAYLVDGLSHRQIQRNILNLPAPARGGGFVAMEILHHFDIREDKKGIIKERKIREKTEFENKRYQEAIDILTELVTAKEEAERYFTNPKTTNKKNNITESKSEIKIRVYQSKLREIVLANYKKTCAVCDINKTDLLVCSHIIPWSVKENERLNPENAICFCALHDKLFDKGYFSLDSEYRIIFGSKADNQIKQLLKDLKFKTPVNNKPNTNFLIYHYNEICTK